MQYILLHTEQLGYCHLFAGNGSRNYICIVIFLSIDQFGAVITLLKECFQTVY